jgi:hypothetical protein
MAAFILTLLVALVGPPPANPPFDYDTALMRQMDPNVRWSRPDIAASGELIGIVQREYPVGFGLIVEDVYPFGGAKPFRRLNSTATVARNLASLLSIMGGEGPLPK